MALLAIADSVRLVLRARAQAILDPLDRAVYAVAGPLELLAETFAVAGRPGRFHRAGQPGVWYACIDLSTAFAEVVWHQRRRLRSSGLSHLTVRLVEVRAAFAGSFADLRMRRAMAALNPDIVVGWPAGQAFADRARGQRLDGVVWPSVRDPGKGDTYALLEPGGVRAVRWGDGWRMPVTAASGAVGASSPDTPLVP